LKPLRVNSRANHALSVSVEIELKIDWQRCKQVLYFQILHINGWCD